MAIPAAQFAAFENTMLFSKKRATAGSNPTSYPKTAFGIYEIFSNNPGQKNGEALDAETFRFAPRTKSQPSAAVVILEGGAAA